jgi:hypothetical protein
MAPPSVARVRVYSVGLGNKNLASGSRELKLRRITQMQIAITDSSCGYYEELFR